MNLEATTTIGLEVSPNGPYAVLLPPFNFEPVVVAIRSTTLLLMEYPRSLVPMWRVTARVQSMTGRYTSNTGGPVHLRGFADDGRMLWRIEAVRAYPAELVTEGSYAVATFEVEGPTTFWWLDRVSA